MMFVSGPGTSGSAGEPQLEEYSPLVTGDQLRDRGDPHCYLPAGIRGRDVVLERAQNEARRVPSRGAHPSSHDALVDIPYTLHISNRRRRSRLPRHQQRLCFSPRYQSYAGTFTN